MKKLFIISAIICSAINLSFSQGLTLQLTPSQYYQNYNISCNGMYDGSIDLTITGGTAPYTIHWSNGTTSEDLSGLPAGYYSVHVTDAVSTIAQAGITLTEPSAMRVTIIPFEYTNGYNVTPWGNYNGSIDLEVEGGEPPYTYLWNNNATTQDITGLNADFFYVTITDAAGCVNPSDGTGISLRQPERNDWQMTGNTGSNPATQFIGTSDAQDFVFRTDNLERMRLTGIGDVKINALQGTGNRMVYADANGNLKVSSLSSTSVPIPWFTVGNQVTAGEFIGSVNNEDFIIKTNNSDRMIITKGGIVGIGTTNPQQWNYMIPPSANPGLPSNRVLHIEGERPSVRLTNTLDGIDFTMLAANGTAAIESSRSFAIFLDADNSGTDEAFWIIKNNIYNLAPAEVLFRVNSDGYAGARGMRVTQGGFPDYVFKEDYPLMSLHELDNYIKQNQHLPGVPTACEVEDNGLDLGEMQVTLVKKIEELTLYVIELKKENKKMQEEITEIKNKVK